MPGKRWPTSSSRALTVAPFASTVDWPSVCGRIGVGMWTRMDIRTPRLTPLAAQPFTHEGLKAAPRAAKKLHQRRLTGPFDQRLELLQRRLDQRRPLHRQGDRVLRLQPVAG